MEKIRQTEETWEWPRFWRLIRALQHFTLTAQDAVERLENHTEVAYGDDGVHFLDFRDQ